MVSEARRAVVDGGLQGFTIEQLCERVGVSRRTFFNHFASKEDVVLGIELNADTALLAAYADGSVVPATLAPLPSVIALIIEQLHVAGIDRADEALVRHVFEREPALTARFLSATDTQIQKVADAVRQRFSWNDPADPRARLVAEAAVGVIRVSAGTYFDDDFDEASGPRFDELLDTNLRLMTEAITIPAQEGTS
jgi:AcrR family transcriptional regulator